MARKQTFGTPNQSKAYLFPARRRGRLIACWVGVAIVAAALAVDAFTSRSLLVSPGTLSKSHALVRSQEASSSDCTRCHSPFSAPTDDRCVGCHEPRTAVSRFANKAHTEQIQAADRGTTGAKHPTHPPACIFCHTEHQGLDARIGIVANSACAGCHGFRSFGRSHPEFGILRQKRPEDPGVKFNHKRHLEELAKKNLAAPQACETCHHPNAGRTEFAPVSFDRDCSSCHFQDKGTIGATAPLPPEMIVTIETISATDPSPSWREYASDFDRVRDRLVKKTIRHRDAWIRYNVTRLAAAIEGGPTGAAGARPQQADLDAKVAALKSELDDVNRQRGEATSAQSPDASKRRISELQARAAQLTTEIAGLRAKIAQGSPDTTSAPPPPPAADQVRASLAEVDEILSILSSRKESWAHEEGERLRAKRAQIAAHVDQTGPGWSSAGLGARREEIDRRLEDLARLGASASSVSALRRDLGSIGSSASPSAPASTAAVPSSALEPSLSELDAAIDAVGARPEPWAKEEAERLRAKKALIAPRAQLPSPAWPSDVLGRRRAEISGMLDALTRGGADKSQIAALRRDLDGIAPASGPASGASALRSQLDARERALASAKQESERLQALLQQPSGAASADAASLDQRRAQIEAEIHALEDLPHAPAAGGATSLDPEEAAKTIEKMLKPCMKCHLEANHTIGRTAAARSVLPAATFNHKPHLQQATCTECHGKISASEEAADLSLDGISKCQSCHKWRAASNACQTCHRYHPEPVEPSVAGMDPQGTAGGPS